MDKKNCENGKEKKIRELLATNKPLLLEIRTECCDDTYLTERIFQKIENEFNNDIRIARIDYKTYKKLFPDVDFQNFPMVAIIKNKVVSKAINGNMSRTNLKALAYDLIKINQTTAKAIMDKKNK